MAGDHAEQVAAGARAGRGRPSRGGLDALRQVVEPDARCAPARSPQAGIDAVRSGRRPLPARRRRASACRGRTAARRARRGIRSGSRPTRTPAPTRPLLRAARPVTGAGSRRARQLARRATSTGTRSARRMPPPLPRPRATRAPQSTSSAGPSSITSRVHSRRRPLLLDRARRIAESRERAEPDAEPRARIRSDGLPWRPRPSRAARPAGPRRGATSGHASRRQPVRWRKGSRRSRGGPTMPSQPLVEVVHADEVVEDPLVDLERRRRERALRELDHPPVTERRRGSERAPVRVGKCRERDAEGRPARTPSARPASSSTPAHRSTAPRARTATGARPHERLDRGLALRQPLGGAVRLAPVKARVPGRGGHEIRLVRLAPVGGLDGYGITTFGSSNRGVAMRPCSGASGLSAPSTWILTRYVPSTMPSTAKSGRLAPVRRSAAPTRARGTRSRGAAPVRRRAG